jgi:methylmalonyl-CoA/ethylmalonyl-CoA epimerase
MRDPVFTETIQIAIVVRDIDATMRRYVEDYGIGPWDVYEFNPDTVKDLREDGEPVERSWRLALSQVGQMQWELIQPLDEESIYARFLAEKGEGLHHIGVAVESYEDTLAALEAKGRSVVLGGEYGGLNFAYLGTDGDLGVITEIFSGAPGADQRPDAVYPPA